MKTQFGVKCEDSSTVYVSISRTATVADLRRLTQLNMSTQSTGSKQLVLLLPEKRYRITFKSGAMNKWLGSPPRQQLVILSQDRPRGTRPRRNLKKEIGFIFFASWHRTAGVLRSGTKGVQYKRTKEFIHAHASSTYTASHAIDLHECDQNKA